MAAAGGNCLHLVASPCAESLALCASQFRAGDHVLFLDAGVMILAEPQSAFSVPPADSVFYSEPDLAARGLLELARNEGLQLLPDEDFPGLLARHSFCLTWK
jgi:sulfur relay protein TusB/DsrH